MDTVLGCCAAFTVVIWMLWFCCYHSNASREVIINASPPSHSTVWNFNLPSAILHSTLEILLKITVKLATKNHTFSRKKELLWKLNSHWLKLNFWLIKSSTVQAWSIYCPIGETESTQLCRPEAPEWGVEIFSQCSAMAAKLNYKCTEDYMNIFTKIPHYDWFES